MNKLRSFTKKTKPHPASGELMAERIVLVDFTWTRDKDPRVPLGHASIAAALRAAGVEVITIVHAVNLAKLDPTAVAQEIAASAGDADVAIGAYVWAEDLLQAIVPALRADGFAGRIILGGPQISYATAGVERLYPGVDAFVRGYGEQAIVDLLRSPTGTLIRGVHWAGQPDRVLQAEIDLEQLPSPWLAGEISLVGQDFVRWETQRGCPFRCTFCQHREAGARLRRRTLDERRIGQEIDLFCKSGVSDIAVLDPIFNAGPHAVEVLRRFADRGFAGRLSLQCRAELVDEAFLDVAARLNVRLEFGLQTIHKGEGAAVKRRNHIGKVDEALSQVRQRGIAHEVSLIFGLPGQTLRSFEESVAWCLERQVPVIKAFPLLLLRGTQLDLERQRWGFETEGGAMARVTRSNSFTRADWLKMAQVSDVLSETEGRHPRDIERLVALAAQRPLALDRWQPQDGQVAA